MPEQYKGPEEDGAPTATGRTRARVTDGNGNGYRTFSGAGFGTLMMQLSLGPKETPPVASTRAYLRNGLPALYQDGDFGMRFIGALEKLLDPIVAILDALPSHFDPNFAPPRHPRPARRVARAWSSTRRRTSSHQREMVRRAAELGRRRGTVAGLELALSCISPTCPLRVEDDGGVIWHGKPAKEGMRRRTSSSTATSPSTPTAGLVARSSSSTSRCTRRTGCA